MKCRIVQHGTAARPRYRVQIRSLWWWMDLYRHQGFDTFQAAREWIAIPEPKVVGVYTSGEPIEGEGDSKV